MYQFKCKKKTKKREREKAMDDAKIFRKTWGQQFPRVSFRFSGAYYNHQGPLLIILQHRFGSDLLKRKGDKGDTITHEGGLTMDVE